MKFSIQQQGAKTTTGTQNWTDAVFSSDVKGAIFWGGQPSVNATNTANVAMFIGATDLTRSAAFAANIADATSGVGTGNMIDATNCVAKLTSGVAVVAATYSATLSNGVTLNYTAASGTANLINGLILGGADIEFGVSTATFAATDSAKTVTHNLTGTPDALIIVWAGQAGTLGTTGPFGAIIGFWDGVNSVGAGIGQFYGGNPTQVSARLAAAADQVLGHETYQDIDVYSISVSSVGATTLSLNRSATGTQVATAMVIAIRHLSGNFAAKAVQGTLNTGTGNQAVVSGMSGAPQLLFMVPTRLTANTLSTSDTAGSWGFGVAANNAGTTQQGATAISIRDAASGTSVSKTQSTNANVLWNLDTNGAVQNAGPVNSWDSGGVTVNQSTASGSAFEYIALALGNSVARVPSMTLLGVG